MIRKVFTIHKKLCRLFCLPAMFLMIIMLINILALVALTVWLNQKNHETEGDDELLLKT